MPGTTASTEGTPGARQTQPLLLQPGRRKTTSEPLNWHMIQCRVMTNGVKLGQGTEESRAGAILGKVLRPSLSSEAALHRGPNNVRKQT